MSRDESPVAHLRFIDGSILVERVQSTQDVDNEVTIIVVPHVPDAAEPPSTVEAFQFTLMPEEVKEFCAALEKVVAAK